MATSYSSTIKVYSGVPLVKGGTEVLYLSQGAAEGVLGAFLKATYSNYYFVRENRQAVQIDAPYGDLDDVNYISFTNASHGGKIFFGFVDRVVYINDNCTQIEFTIDPFPTYLGDTKERDFCFVKRNTARNDTRNFFSFFTDDYQINSPKYEFYNVGGVNYQAAQGVVYFASATVAGTGTIQGTGIKTGVLSQTLIEDIQQNGGVIIGAYIAPAGWTSGAQQATTPESNITVGDPFRSLPSVDVEKVKSGVYCKLALTGPSETKYYNIEDFSNPESISFGVNRLLMPCPAVFIYPINYKGMYQNLAEGFLSKFPAIPISANAVYTTQQRISELLGAGAGLFGGAMSGAAYGPVGAVLGAGVGAVTPMIKGAYTEYMTRFQPPAVIGHGEPIVDGNFNMIFGFNTICPETRLIRRISDYLKYYGYACNTVMAKADINTRDEDYLQTGDIYLAGSEADDELNARLMSGIKIRKTLS